MPVFIRHITFLFFLALLMGCERNVTYQPEMSVASYHSRIEEIHSQIKKQIEAGNHEAYIRGFIRMLDLVQQLPAEDPELFNYQMQLIHFANIIGLYHQGIELTDLMIDALENDTSMLAIQKKELLFGAKAACYYELQQYDEARKAYRQDIYYKSVLYPGYPQISTWNNIGMTFNQEGREDSAMFYFQEVQSILKGSITPLLGDQQNDEIFYGSVKDNIASILLHRGEYTEAGQLYRENFAMYSKYPQHPRRRINAGLQLAQCQLRTFRTKEAGRTLQTLDSLLQSLTYTGQREHKLLWYQQLAAYYDQSGETDKVIAYQHDYMELSDSLYAAQMAKTRLANEELIRYKALQFSNALNLEKREALLQEQKAQFRFWLLLLVILVSLTGGLFGAISLRQRLRLARKDAALHESEKKLAAAHALTMEQEKTLLDIALEQKKKDISAMALNATIKKEWAERLDVLLSHVEESRGHRRVLALKKLREEIRGHIHADHRIDQFQENIETLSAEFYDNLNTRNPDLSKNDIRLISFLKLRMSNDEIAMMQGISTKSVIMSRYRLKKKLCIPEHLDLDAFCHQL